MGKVVIIAGVAAVGVALFFKEEIKSIFKQAKAEAERNVARTVREQAVKDMDDGTGDVQTVVAAAANEVFAEIKAFRARLG